MRIERVLITGGAGFFGALERHARGPAVVHAQLGIAWEAARHG